MCKTKRKYFAILSIVAFVLSGDAYGQDCILLEAEGFTDHGGWLLDQQFMDQMGSSYLLAHGLGEPVQDAKTTATFPAAGTYRVWVRTRDWVAPWRVPGAPGRFQLVVGGKPLATTFGTEGAAWHWQDGGTVDVGEKTEVVLHDLTGFEGRCDAVLFCKDLKFSPPNEGDALTVFRHRVLEMPKQPEEAGAYDLVVVGGGIAGTSAAVTAARLGLTVALVQDRPVLGGNGSSEVRVWPEGHIRQKPYPRIGDVVAELVPKKTAKDGNAKAYAIYADARKLAVVRAEKKIRLFLEHRVQAAESKDNSAIAVLATQTRSGRKKRIVGRWFLDSTGDGIVGALVGADFEITHKGHMGASNLWNLGETTQNELQLRCQCKDLDPLTLSFTKSDGPIPFPRCPWAIDLSDKPFPGRNKVDGKWAGGSLNSLGGWFWETGFDDDPINDVELMRDRNFRAMYGAWDTLKNVDKAYPNHRLQWAAYIAGKRESRRLLGDVVLTGDDFRSGRPFPDACFPCSWSLDLHLADPAYQKGNEGDAFISRATFGKYKGPYWAPYRTLYSRNIDNLFMAGRDISVTHEALGAVRVMKTCGMMGEIVGMAAAICRRRDCNPRDVYESHLEELKEQMRTPLRVPE